MNNVVKIIIGIVVATGIALILYVPNVFSNNGCTGVECVVSGAGTSSSVDQNTKSVPSLFKSITNTLLYITGAVAVIMLVIGGVRYTTSNGDAKNVEAAKNTILYSVIGLVVAIMAYAVVNFVIINL